MLVKFAFLLFLAGGGLGWVLTQDIHHTQAHSRFVIEKNLAVKVGGTTVVIRQQYHGQGKAFVHLHQNETTALMAAKAVIKTEGGSLLTLVHPGARNIVFRLHHKRYEFDPNRIFTDVGIKKTLSEFGPYTSDAHAHVKKLAGTIKKLLPKGKVIAVHNNQSYSLKNYFPGHELAGDAKKLSVNGRHSYRNFYLVTKGKDFQRLKKLKFNSIWQADDATDDGSLSVYLASSHYINVEAGYHQLAAQIKMLKYA